MVAAAGWEAGNFSGAFLAVAGFADGVADSGMVAGLADGVGDSGTAATPGPAATLAAVAGFSPVGDASTVSLPITSMINRSGSRNVKLVTCATVPTKTTRTVDKSYWPTRICCNNPDLTGHCFPIRAEFSLAGEISMKTRSGS